MHRLLLVLFAASAVFSCQSGQKGKNLFSDEKMVAIADLKDRRATDSLMLYFDEDVPYRREAVMAFGSVQDSAAVDAIGNLLLNDPDPSVRLAAVFALGQTICSRSAALLQEGASREKDIAVLKEILEEYGKTARAWSALHDPAEDVASGIAWSLYRAGLRNNASPDQNELAATLLNEKYETSARLGAAHYFARSANDFESYFGAISKAALHDESVDVRMAATSALRKISSVEALDTLRQIITSEDDYRVRTNAIRALNGRTFSKTKDLLLSAIRDKNPNVAVAASEVIRDNATEEFWIDLANRVVNINNARVRGNLYQAVLKLTSTPSIIEEVKTAFSQSSDPYERSAYLTALQESLNSYRFVEDALVKADTPVVRSTAAAALVAMDHSPGFPASRRREFAGIYASAIATGDPAVIGIVAGALGDSKLGYREIVKDISFLYDARKRLELPRDNEALQPLEAAIAYFENKTPPQVKNEFNNPIDWEVVREIPRDARAIIKTNRGHIIIRLLVDEAPGSVANFVKLARANYFDGKLFHRVVPNFVIQAGCNRGDGWGSEDYSIRSEFTPRRYTTGSVGMASAGKDTEGTQWFITHSPTPHLDGRYTIFAEVEDGMNVVHMIEVGDQINDVELVFGKDNK